MSISNLMIFKAATLGGGPLNEKVVRACGLFSRPLLVSFSSFMHLGLWVLFTCGINFRYLYKCFFDRTFSDSLNTQSCTLALELREHFPLQRFPLLRFTATPAPCVSYQVRLITTPSRTNFRAYFHTGDVGTVFFSHQKRRTVERQARDCRHSPARKAGAGAA